MKKLTCGPVTIAASNMISSKGLMSLLATRQRPLPARHFTLSRDFPWSFISFLMASVGRGNKLKKLFCELKRNSGTWTGSSSSVGDVRAGDLKIWVLQNHNFPCFRNRNCDPAIDRPPCWWSLSALDFLFLWTNNDTLWAEVNKIAAGAKRTWRFAGKL